LKVQGITIPIDYNKQLDLAGRNQQACPLCRLGLTVRYTVSSGNETIKSTV